MGESDKFEKQGRAHAALKQAKSNVATNAAALNETAKNLDRIVGLLRRFTKDPQARVDNLPIEIADELKIAIRRLDLEAMQPMIDEYRADYDRVATLQAQVDQF